VSNSRYPGEGCAAGAGDPQRAGSKKTPNLEKRPRFEDFLLLLVPISSAPTPRLPLLQGAQGRLQLFIGKVPLMMWQL